MALGLIYELGKVKLLVHHNMCVGLTFTTLSQAIESVQVHNLTLVHIYTWDVR